MRSRITWLVALPMMMGGAALVAGACADFRSNDVSPGGGADGGDAASGGGEEAGAASDAPSGDAGGGGDAPASGDGGTSDAGGANVCTEAHCPPAVVAGGLYAPAAVAVDASHVYWAEVGMTIPNNDQFGQLVRLPKGTSCADRSCFDVIDYTVLAGQFEGALIYDTLLALSPRDICYSQSFDAKPAHFIRCYSLDTVTLNRVDNSDGDVVGLWIGGGSATWAIAATSGASADGAIRTIVLDGGAATSIASSRPSPSSVTSDGARAYWTELGDAGTGTVDTALDDGGVSVLAAAQADPVAAKLFGGFVYWLDSSSRAVMRTRADGSGAAEQIASTDVLPFALAVDASGVYWVSYGTSVNGSYGALAHAPLAPGGETTVMMSNVAGIQSLALDATDVYVAAIGTSAAGGRIVRINKTY